LTRLVGHHSRVSPLERRPLVWVVNIYIATSDTWVEEVEEYNTRDEAEEDAEELRQVYMPPDVVRVKRKDNE
jgi:hypothetical protein